MPSGTRRTFLTVRVLIETQDGSAEDHERTVAWVASRIKTTHSQIKRGYVAVAVKDETGESHGFAGHGHEMSPESREIMEEFFDVSDTS